MNIKPSDQKINQTNSEKNIGTKHYVSFGAGSTK